MTGPIRSLSKTTFGYSLIDCKYFKCSLPKSLDDHRVGRQFFPLFLAKAPLTVYVWSCHWFSVSPPLPNAAPCLTLLIWREWLLCCRCWCDHTVKSVSFNCSCYIFRCISIFFTVSLIINGAACQAPRCAEFFKKQLNQTARRNSVSFSQKWLTFENLQSYFQVFFD